MTDDTTVVGEAPADGLRIDIVRGTPNEEELAAVVAVLTDAYAQEAADAEADEVVGRTGWQLSQRSLRAPLRRDLGWGHFG